MPKDFTKAGLQRYLYSDDGLTVILPDFEKTSERTDALGNGTRRKMFDSIIIAIVDDCKNEFFVKGRQRDQSLGRIRVAADIAQTFGDDLKHFRRQTVGNLDVFFGFDFDGDAGRARKPFGITANGRKQARFIASCF